MKVMRKFSLLLIGIMVALIVACTTDTTVTLTGIKLEDLEGTGTLASPYVVTIEVGQTLTTPITLEPSDASATVAFGLGKMESGAFVAYDNSDTKVIELATTELALHLSVRGLVEGEGFVELSAASIRAYVKVIVEAEDDQPGDDILVTSITFPLISDGNGSLSNPYHTSVAATQEADYSFAVLPNNATDKTITWEVGTMEDDVFTPLDGEDDAIIEIVDATAIRLTIKGLLGDESGYIRGTAVDGSNTVVYMRVDVEAFNPVEEIIATALLEGDETDYVFKTAKNTTWDMSASELSRKDNILAGIGSPGGGQAVNDLTYWPSLYNFGIDVAPQDASNKNINISYSEAGIFTLNLDGSYQALSAGTTIVTISSASNPEVSVTVEVVVEDTLYPGILKEDFDNKEISVLSSWDFDENPDNLGSRPLLEEWENVILQTNSLRGSTGDDGNQKIFYLGTSDRVYGIALEGRVNTNRGDINRPTALVWNKVYISEVATTIDLVIGNNDKTHGQYRIVLVDEQGSVYVVQDWTGLTTPNASNRINDLEIPAAAKGKELAFVIEHRLTQTNDNAELHLKAVFINQYTPVMGMQLEEIEGTYGQGAQFELNTLVTPANATNKTLLYSVSPSGAGVSVNQGIVSIALGTDPGEYTITVVSQDNSNIYETYLLTVTDNVPTTDFEIMDIEDGDILNATYDPSTIVSHTDIPYQLYFTFNEGASDTTWSVDLDGTSVTVSQTGLITFVGVGTTTVTITPNANEDLVIMFDVVVSEYTESSLVAPGVYVTQTEAQNTPVSQYTSWLTQSLVRSEWRAENVNRDHGASKVDNPGDDTGRIVLEGHAPTANFTQPINIIWNKVFISEDINSFKFMVRSHDDDRVLESTNFRVKVIELGETFSVDTLLDWTTIAGRWKQGHLWYDVLLDVSTYQGSEIIILIEQTGSLQNNGDWAKYSDSGAGAYFHIKGFELLEAEAPSITSQYRILAAFTNQSVTLPDGFAIENNPYTQTVIEDGELSPFKVVFNGELNTIWTLSTDSPFSSNGNVSAQPYFYIWGLFPALNNHHNQTSVSYEVLNDGVLSLDENVLTVLQAGTTTLKVNYLAFGSTDIYVALDVTVEVQ